MRAIRKATLEVASLAGRALLSVIGPAVTERLVPNVEVKTLWLDGSLRGRIIDRSGSIVVTGHGQFRTIGKVAFVATFNETVGLDTISLTDGVVTLTKHAEKLTLSVSPTTAVVPRNQFSTHFTATSGVFGSGRFKITTFVGARFVAKLHSSGS
jgi:hypothetical protein